MECDHCGRHLDTLSYTCSKCDEEFCTEHRLPESHDCIGLKVEKAERELKRQEGEEVPWFDDDATGSSESDNTTARVERTVSGTSSITEQETNPEGTRTLRDRTKEKQKKSETRREKLEKEGKEQFSSPDVNLDGSLDKAENEKDDGEANSTVTVNDPKTFVGFVTNGISYGLFALALVAFYQFFAPVLGTPTIGALDAVLPTIFAPTEHRSIVVDAAPAIVGVVAGSLAVYIR